MILRWRGLLGFILVLLVFFLNTFAICSSCFEFLRSCLVFVSRFLISRAVEAGVCNHPPLGHRTDEGQIRPPVS